MSWWGLSAARSSPKRWTTPRYVALRSLASRRTAVAASMSMGQSGGTLRMDEAPGEATRTIRHGIHSAANHRQHSSAKPVALSLTICSAASAGMTCCTEEAMASTRVAAGWPKAAAKKDNAAASIAWSCVLTRWATTAKMRRLSPSAKLGPKRRHKSSCTAMGHSSDEFPSSQIPAGKPSASPNASPTASRTLRSMTSSFIAADTTSATASALWVLEERLSPMLASTYPISRLFMRRSAPM
mmetsp:Transcript_63730/g.178340  ORF Transcript_63730/g.178340 Transcript_63730/m.178340 type:complete len:241 (-) Transcript_63730:598-1320(-)